MKIAPYLTLSVGLLAGCATTKPIEYYYGNYERAYYHNIKDGTPASLYKYEEALQDVIKTSKEKGLRVPPGIYCEYGYLLAQQGSPNANKFFALEVATYPESERFVAFVKSQIKKQ